MQKLTYYLTIISYIMPIIFVIFQFINEFKLKLNTPFVTIIYILCYICSFFISVRLLSLYIKKTNMISDKVELILKYQKIEHKILLLILTSFLVCLPSNMIFNEINNKEKIYKDFLDSAVNSGTYNIVFDSDFENTEVRVIRAFAYDETNDPYIKEDYGNNYFIVHTPSLHKTSQGSYKAVFEYNDEIRIRNINITTNKVIEENFGKWTKIEKNKLIILIIVILLNIIFFELITKWLKTKKYFT